MILGDVHDVIVVGGGPAGSAAAIGLRRAGASVLLLERQEMPRDKPCGDILGTQALSLVAELGLDRRALDPFPPLRGFALHVAGRRPKVSRERDLASAPRVVPRKILDAALIDLAVRAGAELRQARVDQVLQHGETIVTRSRSGDHESRLVIGADGWGSVVARSLFEERHAGQTGLAGRAYVHDPRGFEGLMRVFYSEETRPGYGWLFPIDRTHANVGVGVLRSDGHALPALFRHFLEDPGSPLLNLLGDGASVDSERTWPLALGWTARRRAAGRALLAGDAASLVGPLTGAGIHSAIRSGLMAARSAAAALAAPASTAFHLAAYERDCARWFRPRLGLERLIQRGLAAPAGLGALSALFTASPRLDALWTHLLFSLG
jgi:geranylgeranyl reductase family protein